jgi:hypothetical protein
MGGGGGHLFFVRRSHHVFVSLLFAVVNEKGGNNYHELHTNSRTCLGFGGAIKGDGAARPKFVGGIDESRRR